MAGFMKTLQGLLSWRRKSGYVSPNRTSEENLTDLSLRKERAFKNTLLHTVRDVVSKPQGSEGTRELWVPFVLRRKGMLLFLGVYVALLVTLVFLYIFSNQNHGLVTVKQEDLHYLWTYGPTAVFMILAACWYVVQYRAMQLMPWLLMLRSPRCPSDGILLDYISDWVMTSLFNSVKRKHLFVTLPILGTLLLTGATVTSTGLLVIQTVRFDRATSMCVPWGFSGSDYDPEAVDSRAFATHMAVELFDGSSPLGLQENHAFPTFYAEGEQAGDTFMSKNLSQATVDVFTMNLDCEDAPVTTPGRSVIATHPRDENCWHNYDGTNFGRAYTGESAGSVPDYRLFLKLHGCDAQETRQPAREIDWRIWTLLAHKEPNGTIVDTGTWILEDGPEGPYYNKSAAFVSFKLLSKVCTPRYSIRRALTSISYTNDSSPALSTIDFGEQNETDTIPGVSAHDVLYGAWHSLSVSTNPYQSPFADDDPPTPAALLLSFRENGMGQYWGTDRLQREIEQKLSIIGAQVARQYLLKPADTVTRGRAISVVKRLVVRDLAFGLVAAMLGLLIAISCVLIIVYLPAAACPRDPGSIAGLATILARSPEMMEDLTDMGSKPISAITALISDQKHSVSVTYEGDFAVTTHRVPSTNRSPYTGNDQIEWWRPLSVRVPVRSLTFGIPMALICTLESLSQHSKKAGGIAPIENEISPVQYTWTYIPALVMLAVRILFHDLESCARTFQPYNYLQRAHAVPRMSILEDYRGKLSLVVLLDAIRKRHWALAAAAMGVLVSFALPIAVAGLYTTDTVMKPIEANITRLDRWNYADTTLDIYTRIKSKENLLGGLLLYLDDVTEPQWTHQTLAVSKVVLSDLSMDPGYLDARLPALRSTFVCEHYPPDQITWEIKGLNADPLSRGLFPTTIKNKACTGSNPQQFPFAVELPRSEGYFFGQGAAGSQNGCPQFVEVFGKANGLREEDIENFFVLGCRQSLEQVDVDLRLSLPSYNLDLSKTPTIVANSSKVLVERWNEPTVWGGPAVPTINDALLDFSMGNNEGKNLSMLDRTLIASIYGINGTKNPDDYLDPTRYIERKNWVIGIVTAQILNIHARVNLNTSEQHVIGTANLFRPRLYVVQSRISTSILEGALAAMVLCGAAAITLMKTRRVLPKNPTTIAAVASLLAGSEMMKENVIPRGSEWCDDKELKRRRVFEDLTFSMKWWPGQKEPAATDDDEGPETRSNGSENPASRASSRSRSNDEPTLRESLISRDSSHSNAGSTLRGSSVSSEHRSIGEGRLPNEAVQEEELSLSEVPSNEALAGDPLDQDQISTSAQERPRDRFGIDVDQLAVSV